MEKTELIGSLTFFPLLDLPRDIIRLLAQKYLDSHCDKRNFMIICKHVYNCMLPSFRREHLFDLSAIYYRSISTNKITGRGNRLCPKCSTLYKGNKSHEVKCKGLIQCSKCWGFYRYNSHYCTQIYDWKKHKLSFF